MPGLPLTDLIVAVFVVTYIGMAFGRWPWLKIDRSGIALIGAIVLIAAGALTVDEAARAVDLPTLLLLFGLMIVSAQYGASGFYDGVAAKVAQLGGSPKRLLAAVILLAGGLSALLANDIVVFAMTPLLCHGLRRRGLNPTPYLIALACAANAGSAATMIGNPQNILIGQVGKLDFTAFLGYCAVPALAALGVTFAVVALQWRGRWIAAAHDGTGLADVPLASDRLQLAKALIATAVLLVLFFTDAPREVSALAIAALLLVSRKLASRELVAAVDFRLLLLFAGLFVVTGALAATPLAGDVFARLAQGGWLPDRLATLTPLALALTNTIGNVPAVILLLKVWPQPPEGALYGLALLSTLAGNLLIVGSLANIIVAERAAAVGVKLGFADHAKVGVPVTLISMAFAAIWLWMTGALPA
ncbi:MAG TPA: SLC13 family permease [Alphaproteobacteria bacterium]|jgi:Na+/H+ antiporter NhaD/arsenite permease-like protein